MKTVRKIQLAGAMYRVISMARKVAGANNSVRVIRKGLRWELDLSEGIDLAIFAFGQFEKETGESKGKVTRQDGRLRTEIPDGSGINVLAFAQEQLASTS
jgi:hypothetical protein